jgi:capsular polysaccharide export protein
MRRLLFIGAPFGSFFRKLAKELELNNSVVWRACFTGGDVLGTASHNRVMFQKSNEEWPAFITEFMKSNHIDGIVAFNGALPRNVEALECAQKLGISRYVLENGYLRPHWVTLERDGVNGHSPLPRDPAYYESKDTINRSYTAFHFRMRPHVVSTIKYFIVSVALSPFIKFDKFFYGTSVWKQARGYVREYYWRLTHNEDDTIERIKKLNHATTKVFSFLLQKPGDSQLVVYSKHGNNNGFVKDVIESFCKKAPRSSILIIKQHPFDYGVEKTPKMVRALIRDLQLEDRVFFLRKTSIDIVLEQTDGMVTINSTGGLAAIDNGLPVICLGTAFYDMKGLTFQEGLDRFWTECEAPDADCVSKFISYLKGTSQLNGGFYTTEATNILLPQLVDMLLKDSLVQYADMSFNSSEHEKAALEPTLGLKQSSI